MLLNFNFNIIYIIHLFILKYYLLLLFLSYS